MTTDERIISDLAIVARASRANPISLADTLSAVGASESKPPDKSASQIALLLVARVYVHRVARVWSGATATVCVLAMWIWIMTATHLSDASIYHLLYMSKVWLAAVMLCAVLAAYVVAARLAERALEQAVERATDPLGRARSMVSRVGRSATASPIIGAMMFLLFFGMMQVVLGGSSLEAMAAHNLTAFSRNSDVLEPLTFIDLSAALAVSIAAALLIARNSHRERRWMLAAGIALLVATIAAGHRFDVGPIPSVEGIHDLAPAIWLRSVLTATGTAGLFLIVSAIVLVIRRREDAHVGA
jgi:hypothetical protein